MIGVIHRTEAQISMPNAMKGLWEKATADGLPLEALHRRITGELLLMGRFSLLRAIRHGWGAACSAFANRWNRATHLTFERDMETAMLPSEMDDVLRHLPLRIGVYVPDDLLEEWFAPGTGLHPVSPDAISAAEKYGRKFECEFKYYPEHLEGVFWKWVPAI